MPEKAGAGGFATRRTIYIVLFIREGARGRAPCLYVSYSGEKPKLMRMERLEK